MLLECGHEDCGIIGDQEVHFHPWKHPVSGDTARGPFVIYQNQGDVLTAPYVPGKQAPFEEIEVYNIAGH